MTKIIKKLQGHSGSDIYLMEDTQNKKFIRKTGNVSRNFERLNALETMVPVPKIYGYKNDVLDMEYIHGLDMVTYLKYNNTIHLTNFIIETLNKFQFFNIKDYTEIYKKWLSSFDSTGFPFKFSKEDLLQKLPKRLPSTCYHGDLTLDNIIYGMDNKFYLIDPVTVPFNSYVFDIAKLRQDLDCGWFRRNEEKTFCPDLYNIRDTILKKYPLANNRYLLILMLLRVFKHCEKDDSDFKFILEEANKLWKY